MNACTPAALLSALAIALAPAGAGGQPKTSAPLTASKVEARPAKFPLAIPSTGPITLQLQILLDRAFFSPGIIDGEWGNNAARALAFFTRPDGSARLTGGTPETSRTMTRDTYDRLRLAAGDRPLLREYRVTADDLRGPFTPIPKRVYDQAKLKCLCYASPAEALSERFHTSTKLLSQLNPKVKFESLKAGTVIIVPNVLAENVASPMDTVIIAKLIISKSGFWTHAVDDRGTILAHYPSTLGSGYDPSPTGKLTVTHVARDPAFRYQPKLFSEVPDHEPEALLPPGPNSPVGRVWMSLSRKHYGIHGTSSPETIGYAQSHGCVRLTNWSAIQLSDMVEPGTPVEFH
jgi:lipoprotein-anchoring transpeptidase ErfK/SrfK